MAEINKDIYPVVNKETKEIIQSPLWNNIYRLKHFDKVGGYRDKQNLQVKQLADRSLWLWQVICQFNDKISEMVDYNLSLDLKDDIITTEKKISDKIISEDIREYYSLMASKNRLINILEDTFGIDLSNKNYSELEKCIIKKIDTDFIPIKAINTTYREGLTIGDIELPPNYTWITNTQTLLKAGNNQRFQVMFNNITQDSEIVQTKQIPGFVTINVAKINIDFPPYEDINTVFIRNLRLQDLRLNEGYTWKYPNTLLNAGDEQVYRVIFTHPSGNYFPIEGNVILNVEKAESSFPSHKTITVYYKVGKLLGEIELEEGYEFVNPNQVLLPENNQEFSVRYTDPSGNYYPVDGKVIINIY